MLVERARLFPDAPDSEDVDWDAWPFTVPAVAEILDKELTFTRPVTFLVGENGSGKSTIVEAIAEAYGLDAQGARAGRKYGNDREKTLLGQQLRLDMTAPGSRMKAGARNKRSGFFLRAETAFGLMNAVSGLNGYWEQDTSELSHDEGFLTVLQEMFQQPGLYLMDEPEAALSFSSCLQLVGLIHELGKSGAQVICATHSPILAATPGADVIELGEFGLRRTTWNELEMVNHWQRYLADPSLYLRHVIE